MTLSLPPLPYRAPGRKFKPRISSIIDHVIDRQAQLREQHDEIVLLTVFLRAIAAQRGEQLGPGRIDGSAHLAMAKRIDSRVRLLLSVDWELQQAMRLIDEYYSDEQGRRADLQGVGDLPA
jgi:hypothetical protein